jgi:hypothetical protein
MPIEAAVATLVCVIAIVAVATALGFFFFQAAPTANAAVSISDSFVVRCHLDWGIIMAFEDDVELSIIQEGGVEVTNT